MITSKSSVLLLVSAICLFSLLGCTQSQLLNVAFGDYPLSGTNRCNGYPPVQAAIVGCSKKTAAQVITRQNANESWNGLCALSLAWRVKKMDFFEELIANGADPLKCEKDFSSYLYISAARDSCNKLNSHKKSSSSSAAEFDYLEQLGIKLDEKQKALREMISLGCIEEIKVILNRGADLNFMDENGFHPIDYAVNSTSIKNINTVKFLIGIGANPNLPSIYGESTITRAERFLSSTTNWPRMKEALSSGSK